MKFIVYLVGVLSLVAGVHYSAVIVHEGGEQIIKSFLAGMFLSIAYFIAWREK